MSKKKIWILKFIAGNPKIMTKVLTSPEPRLRSDAIEDAKVMNDRGWRGWVEHSETGERIYETDAEKNFTADN